MLTCSLSGGGSFQVTESPSGKFGFLIRGLARGVAA